MTDLPDLETLKQLAKDITPGPWKLTEWSGISGVGFADEWYRDDPTETANVKLTALAPQLLEEVIRLRDDLHRYIWWLHDVARELGSQHTQSDASDTMGNIAIDLTQILKGGSDA